MKKILYISALAALSLSSCVQDVDDVFDSTASDRVQNAAKEFRNLLVGKEHGWVMEYYPETKRSYGGYIYTLSFDNDDKVTVSGERNDDAAAERTSLYSIQTDMSVTLNFDTYNEIFHYLSDPDPHSDMASIYGFQENMTAGDGYKGDYEFVLKSMSADEIVLQGKKTKNRIRMTPLQEPAGAFLGKLIAMKQKVDGVPLGTVGFRGTVDGKELYFEQDRMRHFTVYYDGMKIGGAAACPTVEGMKLYEPLEIAGKSIQNFSFADNTYTCLDQGAGDVALKSYKDPAYLTYEEFPGSYEMAYDRQKQVVTVEKLVEGKTLLIKGFSPYFDVVMTYDGQAGKVSIHPQKVATTGGLDIWICAYDSKAGYLSWNESVGMVAVWNQSTDNFVLTFEDNGVWGDNVCYGWYYRSYTAGTTSNGAHFNGWGSYSFCNEFKTLTKK